MGFGALYTALTARKAIVLSAIVLATFAAAVIGLILPRQYEASARVLVDSIQKDTITGNFEPRLRVVEFLGQQAAIAGSRTVALETIRSLTEQGFLSFADYETRWREETGGELVAGNDPELWAADELLRRLSIKADSAEGTLTIGFRAEDAAQSARIANAFANAYMATVLDQRQRRAARNAASFSDERNVLERDLEQAQRELSAFREDRGIVAIGEQRLEAADVELAAIAGRLAAARADLSEAESFLRLARSTPDDGLLTLPLPEDALSGRQAQARLGVVRAELARIAERYGPTYPDYVETQNEKRALENNIMQAIIDRTDYARGRVAALEAAVAEQKSKVAVLQETRQAYDVLEEKVNASRNTYELVANRTLQESLQSRIEDVDVMLLARAIPPAKTVTPPLAVIVLIGVFVGAVIGASAAVAVEFAEGRIRTAEALTAVLRSATLVELQGPPKKRRRLRARRAVRVVEAA